MNEQTSKILAEYCGLCWHNLKDSELPEGDWSLKCSLCDEHFTGSDTMFPDFTTGNGWEILSAKIGENGEWMKFYACLAIEHHNPDDELHCLLAGVNLHELPAAEKSRIFAEYLTTGRK